MEKKKKTFRLPAKIAQQALHCVKICLPFCCKVLWIKYVLRDKAGKWSVKAEKHDSVQDFNVNKGKML